MTRKMFISYWTATETYEALKIYVEMDFDGLKESVASMLGGNRCRVNQTTFWNDMSTLRNKDDILAFLINLGYLAYDIEADEVFVPNRELADEFANALANGG